MLRNGYLKLEEGKLHYVKERPVAVRALESCVDKVSAEYFHLEDSDTCELVVLNRNVDFGSCSRRAKAGSKTIRVQNNTKGKVTLVWMHPASENGYACE